MLKKINQRYVCYTDNKITYVLDLDSNFWSMFLGVGHVYFHKRGYIIENKEFNQKKTYIKRRESQTQLPSISLASGVAIMFVVLGRILFDDMIISNLAMRTVVVLISFFTLLLIRVLWSLYQKQQFKRNFTIKDEITVKLDYGEENKKLRLKATYRMNGLFYCLCLMATGLFLISGAIPAYLAVLMTHICILMFGNFVVPTERNSTGLYDVKIVKI